MEATLAQAAHLRHAGGGAGAEEEDEGGGLGSPQHLPGRGTVSDQ